MKQFYKVLLFIVIVSGFNNSIIFANEARINKDLEHFISIGPNEAQITGTSTVCLNGTPPVITFSVSSGTEPFTFTYTINGGSDQTIKTTSGNSVTISVPTNIVDTYTYKLISVKDKDNKDVPIVKNKDTVIIKVINLFSVNAGSDLLVCKGNVISLTATTSGNGANTPTYSWTGPNNFKSNQQNPTIPNSTTAMGGNYEVTATIGDCEVKNIVNVQILSVGVKDPSSLNACVTSGETSALAGLFLSLPTNTAVINTISINWGDGNIQTIPSTDWSSLITHTYDVGGYTVKITTTSTSGCNSVITYSSFIGSSPQAATLSLFANQSTGCSPHTTQFTFGVPINNSNGTNYLICFGDSSACINYVDGDPIPSDWVFSGTVSGFNFYTITHIYTKTSCGNTVNLNGTIYQNVFLPSVVTTNPCAAAQPQAGSLISIGIPPTANFTPDPIPNTCINSPLTITNNSDLGSTIDPVTFSCSKTAPVYWTISPSTPGLWTASGLGSNNNFPNNEKFWTPGSNTPTITFLQPGKYTITLFIKNPCGSSKISKEVCVEAPLLPQFTLNKTEGCTPLNVTATNTTDISKTCSALTYAWDVQYTSGYCGATPASWSYTGGTSASSPNPSFSFITPGTYSIKVTISGSSCGTVTSPVQTVIVKQPPTVTINALPDICQVIGSAAVTPSAVINSCAPLSSSLTYAWSFPGGTPSSSSVANPGIIKYNASGNYIVSLTVSNECGTSTIATEAFTINDVPSITNSPLSQSICSGSSTNPITLTSSVSGTTYSWTATATSGISGFTATGSTATIPSQTITTTNASAGSVTYSITPKTSLCSGVQTDYIVTVLPAPKITSQPTSSSICLGGTASVLSVTISSASGSPGYQWYSNLSNSTTGGSIISGATSSTYTPPTSSVGILYYYCVISLPVGGCANITSNTASVTVNPLPTISTQPQPTQSICVGGTIPALTVAYTGGVGTATYQWYSNTSNATSGGTAISGATSSSFTPPVFNTVGTFYYYAIVSLSGSGCGTTTSTVAEIKVLADPTITTQPIATQTQCQNAPSTPLTVAATGGTGTFSYQWYSNTANTTTNGTALSGATSTSYTPLTATVGTLYYYCIITQTSLGCSVTSSVSSVIVVPAPAITTQPLVNQSVCLNGSTTALTVAYINGAGTASYQWYSNTTNSNSGGTAISGATSATFTPPSATVGTVYYYCEVNFSSGGCSKITSDFATVIINPLPTISSQPQPTQSICVGGTIPALTVAYTGGVGTATYQWYSNTSNATSGGTAISGATSSSFTPPVFNTIGTFYYYAIVSLSGSGCGSATSTAAEIKVLADPTITDPPLITQTLCEGTTPSDLTVTATGGIGTFSYQWYASTSPSNSGGIMVGTNSNSFTPPTSTVGSQYYYCVVTQSGLGCSVTSPFSTVIVVAAPSINKQPQSESICIGGSPSSLNVSFVNGTGTASYQWYDDNGLIANAINSTYTPIVTATTNYYCIITFSSGGCTSITSDIATISVYPLPTIDTHPIATQSICLGGIISPLSVIYTNGIGTPTYQWYSTTANATTGGVPVGTNSSSYTPPAFNSIGTFYYYVEISLTGNGCGLIKSNPSEIIVVGDPTITTQPLPTQTLCEGSTATILAVTATGGIGSYTYQWYKNTPPDMILSGETKDTYSPETTSVGTIEYYCIVSQPNLGCEVVSTIAEVNIVPAPKFTSQPLSSSVCEGGIPKPLSVSYSNGTGIASYQWYSNSIDTNSGGTAISGATSAIYNPQSNSIGTTYYYCEITFSSGGCTLISSETAEVIIYQIPVIMNQKTVVCSGDLMNFIPQQGNGNTVPDNTLYTWTVINTNPSGSILGSTNETVPQNGLNQTLVNNTDEVAIVTYSVTPIAAICTGNSFNVEVAVFPKPLVVFSTPNQTICNETNNSIVDLTSTTPGTNTFNWKADVPIGITGAVLSGSDSIPSQKLLNSSNQPLTVIYKAIGTFNYNGSSCSGPESNYSITVNPSIIASGTISNYNGYGVSYFGATDGSIDLTVSGGSGNYSYSWSGPNGFNSTSEDLIGISAGTYTVSINDGYCPPVILTFILTQPPELLFQEDLSFHVNLLCFGDTNGSLGITITQESIPPYDFQLLNSSGILITTISKSPLLNQVFNGLSSDIYSVRIIDANGGVKTLNGITITQPNDILISAVTTPITCYDANDASITLTVTGGTSPYQAKWDNLATGLYQNNLAAGDYIITVMDANNCKKVITVNIPQAPVFKVTPIVKNISCFGANDGSINLNLVGGIPTVSLTWSDGSTAGTTRNNLGPGTYTAVISDGTPCYITRTFTILEPQQLVLTANTTNAFDCDNANSGFINLLVAGGAAPFTYAWSNGATTEDLNNISAGNYLVTVTDANGCSIIGKYIISRQLPIDISVDTKTDVNCDTKKIKQSFIADVSGGIPPYKLSWSSGTIGGTNNEIMNTETNGVVQLTVTDSYGCIANYTVTVATPQLGSADFTTESYGYSNYGIYSVNDPIQYTTTATGDYESVIWDFGDGTFSSALDPVHTFINPKDYVVTQTVTYPFGCVYEQKITLTIEKGYLLVVPTAFTPNNDRINDTYRPVTKRLKNVRLDVYDTWGSLIYSETGDVLRGWDATIKGKKAENGNYNCKVSAETFYGTIINEARTFVLLK